MSAWQLEAIKETPAGDENELKKWLARAGAVRQLKYLLAYADDGLIWGCFDGEELHLSGDVAPRFSPELRPATLRECRAFGEAGELLLWRAEDGRWRARFVTDTATSESRQVGMPQVDHSEEWIDEDQMLWGSHIEQMDEKVGEKASERFTLLRHRSEGLRHAVPLRVSQADLDDHRLRLRVRHYLDFTKDGEARVALSRLVTLLPGPGEGGCS